MVIQESMTQERWLSRLGAMFKDDPFMQKNKFYILPWARRPGTGKSSAAAQTTHLDSPLRLSYMSIQDFWTMLCQIDSSSRKMLKIASEFCWKNKTLNWSRVKKWADVWNEKSKWITKKKDKNRSKTR